MTKMMMVMEQRTMMTTADSSLTQTRWTLMVRVMYLFVEGGTAVLLHLFTFTRFTIATDSQNHTDLSALLLSITVWRVFFRFHYSPFFLSHYSPASNNNS